MMIIKFLRRPRGGNYCMKVTSGLMLCHIVVYVGSLRRHQKNRLPSGDPVQVHIEFLGLARIITGKKVTIIDISEGATFRELVRHLRRQHPDLIGNVIQPARDELQPPNIFHCKNSCFIKQDQWNQRLKPNEHIVLMSLSAGG